MSVQPDTAAAAAAVSAHAAASAAETAAEKARVAARREHREMFSRDPHGVLMKAHHAQKRSITMMRSAGLNAWWELTNSMPHLELCPVCPHLMITPYYDASRPNHYVPEQVDQRKSIHTRCRCATGPEKHLYIRRCRQGHYWFPSSGTVWTKEEADAKGWLYDPHTPFTIYSYNSESDSDNDDFNPTPSVTSDPKHAARLEVFLGHKKFVEWKSTKLNLEIEHICRVKMAIDQLVAAVAHAAPASAAAAPTKDREPAPKAKGTRWSKRKA